MKLIYQDTLVVAFSLPAAQLNLKHFSHELGQECLFHFTSKR